jgi:hypothetical protein
MISSSTVSGRLQNPRASTALALIGAIAGFIYDLVIFYPGVMSPDTIDQYSQAVSNTYGDWHPPTMAALWHVLLIFGQGPFPMLVFQCTLLWLSFFFLFRTFLRHYPRAALLIVLLFYIGPFLQNFAGVIWKDIHMSTAWLAATSIMIAHHFDQKRMRPFAAATTLALITYGCWVRISGFPAIFPLLYLWWILVSPQGRRTKPAYAAAAGTILGFLVVFLEPVFSRHVLNARKDHIEYKLILHDLTGISVKTGEWQFPSYVKDRETFDTAYLRRNWVCYTFDNIWWNNDNVRIQQELSPDELEDLKGFWRRTMLRHPFTYLKIKLNGYLYFLRLKDSGHPITIVYPETYPNNLGFTYTQNRLARGLTKYISYQAEFPYMKPWFWLFLNALLIVAALFRRTSRKELTLCILFSSLLYFGIHFFVFPAETEFRYFYWNCLSVTIGAVLMLAPLLSGRVPRDNENPV